MGNFWFNLKYVIRHPSYAIQYLNREAIIASLMNVSKAYVYHYLREYKHVNADIEEKLKRLPYLGQMDRRKNEVLYALIRLAKPKVVVETGVGAGVSSTVILRGLEKNGEGRLYSVDAGLKSFDGISLPWDKPTGFLVPEDLRERWTLILGFSKKVLPSLLGKLKIIDFFFHDSEHTYQNMMFEYTVAYKHLSAGGILVSDNIEWNSAFDDFCNAIKARWTKLYTLGILRKFR